MHLDDGKLLGFPVVQVGIKISILDTAAIIRQRPIRVPDPEKRCPIGIFKISVVAAHPDMTPEVRIMVNIRRGRSRCRNRVAYRFDVEKP